MGRWLFSQFEANEQLEALCTANKAAHEAIAELAAERDSVRKACVQLRLETLTEKAKQEAASNTLEVRCLWAKAEVVELKEKIGVLERRGGYRVSPTTTSATLGPYSQPAFAGMGGGLPAQASPQLGGGMSELSVPQEPTTPSVG